MRRAKLIALVLLVAAVLMPAGAAAKSAEYSRFDVVVELRPDGTFHVKETQQVTFSGGPL